MATNVVASQLPKRRPTGTLTARAKSKGPKKSMQPPSISKNDFLEVRLETPSMQLWSFLLSGEYHLVISNWWHSFDPFQSWNCPLVRILKQARRRKSVISAIYLTSKSSFYDSLMSVCHPKILWNCQQILWLVRLLGTMKYWIIQPYIAWYYIAKSNIVQ